MGLKSFITRVIADYTLCFENGETGNVRRCSKDLKEGGREWKFFLIKHMRS